MLHLLYLVIRYILTVKESDLRKEGVNQMATLKECLEQVVVYSYRKCSRLSVSPQGCHSLLF